MDKIESIEGPKNAGKAFIVNEDGEVVLTTN